MPEQLLGSGATSQTQGKLLHMLTATNVNAAPKHHMTYCSSSVLVYILTAQRRQQQHVRCTSAHELQTNTGQVNTATHTLRYNVSTQHQAARADMDTHLFMAPHVMHGRHTNNIQDPLLCTLTYTICNPSQLSNACNRHGDSTQGLHIAIANGARLCRSTRQVMRQMLATETAYAHHDHHSKDAHPPSGHSQQQVQTRRQLAARQVHMTHVG